jgi:hypothetical protein
MAVDKFIVDFESAAPEMAREEIEKRIAYLSPDIGAFRFLGDGARAEFSAPELAGPQLKSQVQKLAKDVQRGLRGVARKLVYRSTRFDRPKFAGKGQLDGLHMLGPGQVLLQGIPLRLFRYFDRRFEAMGQPWSAEPLLTPTLMPDHVIGRANYFRNFPGSLTFACHLPEDPQCVEAFSKRYKDRIELDGAATESLTAPKFALTPATCLHVYHHFCKQELSNSSFGVCGKCFRYESSNMTDLRRLWEFTMREIALIGDVDWVRRQRDISTGHMADVLEELELPGEIRTASDPFFVSPESLAQTWFQLASDTKYEISLLLPDEQRIAVGSHNLHGDFFGRQFQISLAGGATAHSACIAFGLERWIWAFIAEHGQNPSRWPRAVREAREFAGC